MNRPMGILALIAAAGLVAGCSADSGNLFNNPLTTQSINPQVQSGTATPASTKVDPVCAALVARIDQLRQDGVTDRAEQAASSGKSTTVQVKRASLAQLAELDKANAEFQSKCSTVPRAVQQQAAAANVVTPVAVAKPMAPAAAAPAAPAPIAKPQ